MEKPLMNITALRSVYWSGYSLSIAGLMFKSQSGHCLVKYFLLPFRPEPET